MAQTPHVHTLGASTLAEKRPPCPVRQIQRKSPTAGHCKTASGMSGSPKNWTTPSPVRIVLSGATKLPDESFNIKSFNPASDRGGRQLRAGLSVDYDQPAGPFGRSSTQ